MANQKYIDHSYDAFQLLYKYNKDTPDFIRVVNNIQNKNDVVGDLEFQMMIHYAWSMAYKNAMADGFITDGEQIELNHIKQVSKFYDLKSTNRVLFREYVSRQLKDLSFIQSFENKTVKNDFARKYELPKPTPYNTQNYKKEEDEDKR